MSNLNIFMENGQPLIFKKGEHLFVQGDTDSNIYFIKKGLLKAYYLTSDGKEFVKSFLIENELIGSLRAATTQTPCNFSVVCLEDCEVVAIPFKDLYDNSKTNISVAASMIDSLIQLANKKEKREYEFLCLSAQERYELLEKERPEILDRIPLNEIAKYLGITAIALSRIRKRLK
jgi:CRP-like cAMP-binding protein